MDLSVLLITLIIYAAFPLVCALTRKKPITAGKYFLLCIGINFLIKLVLVATGMSSSTNAAFAIWTCVFSAIGERILKKRGILGGANKADVTETTYAEIADTEPTGSQNDDVDSAKAMSDNADLLDILQARFCRHCGVEIAPNAEFCHRCGTKVIHVEQAE